MDGRALPLYAVVETAERPYTCWCTPAFRPRRRVRFLLEHGVDCADGVGAVDADRELLQQMPRCIVR